MILVDTSVWIDHIRLYDPALSSLLAHGSVSLHPFVLGEVALGSIATRAKVLQGLRLLPTSITAFDAEVLEFIDRNKLHGSGIGYVDAHLLVSTRLTENGSLWTRDRRLLMVAERLGIAFVDRP